MEKEKEELLREFEQALPSCPESSPVNILLTILSNYDVIKKETSVVEYDDLNTRILKRFIATKRVENKSEKTLIRYTREINLLLNGINLPVTEINSYHIRYWLGQKENQPSTLQGLKHIYSSFFGWCQNEGIISKNPCALINTIKIPKIQKKAFSSTDLDCIRRSCKNKRDLAIVDFLNSTGCRVGEVVYVKLNDINWIEKSLNVIGKGEKERTVYLDDISIMSLQDYIHERKDDNPYLFIGKGEKNIKENGIRDLLKRIEHLSGVKDIHPHRFRRTLATRLLNRGMRIEEVAEILGHEDISTTRRYCEVTQNNVRISYMKYSI